MSPHVDILDQPERLAPSFFGSLAFHGLLVATIAGIGWVQSRNTISMGDPNGGRLGAVTVNPVAEHRAAFAYRPQESGGHRYGIRRTVPVSKAKPAPKVTVPDPKAIPIPSRNAKLTRPSPAAAPPDKWRASQKDLPNQLYSTAGTRVSTPDFALAGGGGVGVGNNSPFGNQFGAYADLLRTRVAQYWKTTDDSRQHTAPLVGVTFTLHRDGSVTGIRITQKSGISALDISAQRAIMDAAPFPQLPPQFPKNEAEIEFLFQLKQ